MKGKFVPSEGTRVVPREGKRYLKGKRMYEVQDGRARMIGIAKTEAQSNRFLNRGKSKSRLQAEREQRQAVVAAQIAARKVRFGR